MSTISSRRRAFSLIEVVLALGVVAAAVLALIGLMGSTFSTAREVALQHRAINAITALDGALQNPRSISGIPSIDQAKPAFDQIFSALSNHKALNGSGYADFLVFNKNRDGSVGKGAAGSAAVPAVVDVTQNKPTMDTVQADLASSGNATYAGADTGSFLLIRVKVSPLLVGKLYKLDKTTYEADPSATWTNGTDLGATADGYALAYLPLLLEVYPTDLSTNTYPDVSRPEIKPILTQTLVINR